MFVVLVDVLLQPSKETTTSELDDWIACHMQQMDTEKQAGKFCWETEFLVEIRFMIVGTRFHLR